MADTISDMRYLRSPANPPYEQKASVEWGGFVRYIELGDDSFALRQVDEYENGNLVRYDREHWEDQFGTLADFRFGAKWVETWGPPTGITPQEFEAKWRQAIQSETRMPKRKAKSGPPPWIPLFESGKWQGQP